jgi:hypothetical protein
VQELELQEPREQVVEPRLRQEVKELELQELQEQAVEPQ